AVRTMPSTILSPGRGITMHGVDAIRATLQSTQQLVTWFLSDLNDADLLVRPVPGANHIAWQIGHLIVAEGGLVRQQLPDAAYPELPAGFAEKYTTTAQAQEATTGLETKARYLDLFTQARQATIAALNKLTDADLDRPATGNMAKFAPTLGSIFLLVSN